MTNEEKRMIVSAARKIAELEARVKMLERFRDEVEVGYARKRGRKPQMEPAHAD